MFIDALRSKTPLAKLPGNHHHCAGGHVDQEEAGAHHIGGGLVHLLRRIFFCA